MTNEELNQIGYISYNGVIEKLTLRDYLDNYCSDDCTSPRGCEPRLFIEAVDDFDTIANMLYPYDFDNDKPNSGLNEEQFNEVQDATMNKRYWRIMQWTAAHKRRVYDDNWGEYYNSHEEAALARYDDWAANNEHPDVWIYNSLEELLEPYDIEELKENYPIFLKDFHGKNMEEAIKYIRGVLQ